MKLQLTILTFCISLISCESQTKSLKIIPLQGTWELLTATTIQEGDTTVADNRKNQRFLKIINDSHFAFLNHDLNKGKDSSAVFVSGGGRYTLSGNQYAEHLEYCNYREWEDHHFQFTVSIENDTLIQRGIERIEDLGVEREIIEKYVRVQN